MRPIFRALKNQQQKREKIIFFLKDFSFFAGFDHGRRNVFVASAVTALLGIARLVEDRGAAGIRTRACGRFVLHAALGRVQV